MLRRAMIFLLISLGGMSLLAGCATPDRRADILYQPAANVKGGSGDLYLVQGVRPPSGEAAGVEWVLGRVSKSNGEKISRVVSEMAPASLVMDALNQELKAAGYNVIVTQRVPEQVNKALALKDVTIRLDETHEAVKDEANCSVKMSLEPWRNGAAKGISSYEADYTDTAVSGRDTLAADTLQKALQLLMKRSVPDLVKTLEQK